MYITMPAAAGENFFKITSQDFPKMALLSSFFIEKSILEDYASSSWHFLPVLQLHILPNCLFLAPLFNKIFIILKSTMPATAGENFF